MIVHIYGGRNKFKKNIEWIGDERMDFLPLQGFAGFHHTASILRRQTPSERPPEGEEWEKRSCHAKTSSNETKS